MKPIPIDLSNEVLNLLIGLATVLIALLSFSEDIGNKKHFEFIRLLKYRIFILLIFSLIIVFATVLKDYNNEIRNANEIHLRDSLNQKKFDESLRIASKATSKSTAETMAKYYLRYDSATHKIEKLVRDSSLRINKITEKTVTNNTTDAVPEFGINNIKFKKLRNDSLVFEFDFECKKTAVKNLILKVQVLLLKNGFYKYSPQLTDYLAKNVALGSDKIISWDNITITTLHDIYQAFFYFTGYYEYQKEKVPIEFLYFYDFRESKYGIPGEAETITKLFKFYSN